MYHLRKSKVRMTSLMFLLLIISCSPNDDDKKEETEPKVEGIVADYMVDVATASYHIIHGLTEKENGDAFVISQENYYPSSLYKIGPNGQRTTAVSEITDHHSHKLSITTLNNKLYYLATNDDLSKLMSFESEFQQTVEHKLEDNSFLPRNSSIASFQENSLIYFDFSSSKLKKYTPSSKSEIAIAGSGESGNSNGYGAQASFSNEVSKIVTSGNMIFLLDGKTNIRQVVMEGDKFNVTTPIANHPHNIKDIAVDSNQNLYIMVYNQNAIYKLSSENKLVPMVEGYLNIGTTNPGNYNLSVDIKRFNNLFIENDNLFLLYDGLLVKISNFEDKLF